MYYNPQGRKPLITVTAFLIFTAGMSVNAAQKAVVEDASSVAAPESRQANSANQDTQQESQPDYERLRKSVRDYEISIMQLEKTNGAYNVRVAEESIGLGITYRKLGQYQKAIEAFNRALQINRVKRGPEDPTQLPILEQIIKTNTAAADWKALEDNYQLLYWLNQRIYGEDDARLLKVIYRLARWHLHAYLTAFDPIPYKHLLESEKLFHDAVDIIDKHNDPDDPRLLTALYGIIISNYHIVSHQFNSSNNTDDMREIHASNSKMSTKDNVSSMLIWQPLQYNAYEGRKVLKRITDILNTHHELPVPDRATALVNIGDWFLIYGWSGTAIKNYNNAYQLLKNTKTDTATFDRLFAKPVRIPSLTMAYPQPETGTGGETERPYIKFKFNVTRHGCARNIRIIKESDPDKFMYRRRLKDYLHSSLFRPKITGGKPARSHDAVMTVSGAVLKTGTDRRLVNYDRFDYLISVKRCHNAPW